MFTYHVASSCAVSGNRQLILSAGHVSSGQVDLER
jgi:hypothetical protein